MNLRAVDIDYWEKSSHYGKCILDTFESSDEFYFVSQNTVVNKICIADLLTEIPFIEEGIWYLVMDSTRTDQVYLSTNEDH